jgi:hypothetical protein
MVTPDYAVTGWRKAFRIVNGEHLKTSDCSKIQVCAKFDNWGFATSLVQTPFAWAQLLTGNLASHPGRHTTV